MPATKKRKKPMCVDGTPAHHMVYATPMGGLVVGECINGCGHSEVLADSPAAIKKLAEYGR